MQRTTTEGSSMTSQRSEGIRLSGEFWAEWFVVLVLAALTTYTAVFNRPSWDDTYTQLLVDGTATYRPSEVLPRGGDAGQLEPTLRGSTPLERLREAHADRPLMAWLWERLFETSRPAVWFAAMHVVSVVIVGLSAARLWRTLVPSRPEIGAVVAALSIAPITLRILFVLVNPILSGYLGSALVFALTAIFLRRMPHRNLGWAEASATSVVVVLVGLLSEYGTLASLLTAFFLALSAFFAAGDARRRYAVRAALWLVAAAAGYAGLYLTGDRTHRESVDPVSNLETIVSYRWKVIPGRTVEGLWRSIFAGPLSTAGELEISSRAGLRCAALAALITAAAALRRRRAGSNAAAETVATSASAERRNVFVCFLVTGLGVAAVCLLGRTIDLADPGDSRYVIVLLPWAMISFAYCLFAPLAGRAAAAVRLLTLWIAFDAALSCEARLRLENRRLDRLSEIIEPHVAPSGLTLAVLASDGKWIWYDDRDYQLTARLTRNWSDVAKKDRFWSIQSSWYFGNEAAIDALHGVRAGAVEAEPWIDRNLRGIGRHQRIDRVVFVEILDEEKVRLSVAEPGGSAKVLELHDFPK
jgi:hypothetical protein